MKQDLILTQFRKFFSSSWLNHFAKQSGLVKRASSQINGKDICGLLLQAANAPCELSLTSFCQLLFQMKGVKLRAQSLWERIVNPHAVSYMKGVYLQVLSHYTKRASQACAKLDCNFFKLFSKVLLEDSTVIALNQKLTPHFRGTGGLASSSSLKIHLVFDVITNAIASLKIHEGRHPDGALSQDVLRHITKGSLLIRDLGFFMFEAFKKIQRKGAYFLSRLSPGANVYLVQKGGKPINLLKHLNKKYKKCAEGSLKIFLGSHEKIPMRLIFYRVPEQIVNKRLRKLRQLASRRGTTPSAQLIGWQSFTFLITNLPEEMASTSVIGTLYRLRWDIELVFKTWKSDLRLDVLKGTRLERIEVFLYAKLIGILLLGLTCNMLQETATKGHGDLEVSHCKVAKLLMFARAFGSMLKGGVKKEIMDFLSDEYWVKSYCKQKRKRKTTLQRIATGEFFLNGSLA